METANQLPPDALSRVVKEARKEGVFAGLTSGLASGEHNFHNRDTVKFIFLILLAVIGQRLMRFNRNKTLFCGARKQ
ncbi:hypothetical protein H0H92_006878 [Tricholoma furcatifolium]|nr:hypothetical protein H0H92_006878 [Tricholoma furcatifolium]